MRAKIRQFCAVGLYDWMHSAEARKAFVRVFARYGRLDRFTDVMPREGCRCLSLHIVAGTHFCPKL